MNTLRANHHYLFVPFYFESRRNKVTSCQHRLSSIRESRAFPIILTLSTLRREYSPNRRNARFTFEIRLAIVDRVSIAKDYPDREPSGNGCARCYENCELPLAISRVHSEFRNREKKKKGKRERVRVGAITRSGNFVRPSASARRKIVLQRGSFVTAENNETDEFDRVTAPRNWKRSLFRDFVNTIFFEVSLRFVRCSHPNRIYFICDNKYK